MRTTTQKRAMCVAFLALLACEGEEEASTRPAAANATDDLDAGVDAGHDAGPPRPPARLFAKRFVSKIREAPDRDSFRLGYLRAGAVVMATTADPVRRDDPRCRGGWYELTTGGFVCNGRDVIAFWGRRLPQVRGEQPDRSAALPYRYGRTRRDGAPLYRRLPTQEEADEFEGLTTPPVEGAPVEGTEAGAAPVAEAPPTPAPPAPTPAPAQPQSAQPASAEGEPTEEGDVITLASLAGDPHSALARRLVRGFILSLDRDMRSGPRRYWRTISNGFVPYASIGIVGEGPEFRGGRLDDTSQLPIGFIMARDDAYYTRGTDGRARRGGPVEQRHRFSIVREETIGGASYYVTGDDRLFRADDARRIVARERPRGVEAHEKWIEVNLSSQYVIAYEGDRPVYVTLISSGRGHHPRDPDVDYKTPTGLFRVRAKHVAAAMDGDTAADGPYSIDDVPYVMYFQLAYALHGAFWHNGFGYPRSHGCVNLAPRDAQWIFNWSDPQLPDGWHGVYPSEREPGTWIYIHGETPGAR